ncbi:MAG TPA: TIGR00725 family protein [Acidimicrobiales bacterium]|nr:TIGR00725 family protein [Acidimicrobiales bacterium]
MAGRLHVAVVGAGDADEELAAAAEEVGRRLAQAGAAVVCGGLGGVMEAACRGAKSAGGLTIGVLPGRRRADANRWVDVAIPTGMGETRNALVVLSADAVVAVGGEHGTLSEVAFGLKLGRPVVGLRTWRLVRGDGAADESIVPAEDPQAAVAVVLALTGHLRP